MIDVALLSVIRRWRLREGLAIREISRRTGLSRNTIRKYLTREIVEPDVRGSHGREQARRLRGQADTVAGDRAA